MSVDVLPAPLTPPRCNLTDFHRMMIDVPRLFASGFNAAASRSPIAWMIGHKLWYRSWQQVPAASLPDDDQELCHLVELGFDVKTFRKAKALAMRGWVKCADGRLYHPVVAEAALEAWIEKLGQRLSSRAGNATRWHIAFDPEPIRQDIRSAAAMLAMLNPQSKSLAKAARRTSQRDPDAIPPGSPDDPGGIAGRIPDDVPVTSQETGTGTGTGNLIDDDERERASDHRLDEDPAVAVLAAICEVAGIVLEPGDGRYSTELDRARKWIGAKGFDMDRDIRPAIARTLAALPPGETITSLRLIERQLVGQRARAAAKPTEGPKPLDFRKPGEASELERWREVVAVTIGTRLYRELLDGAVLTLEPDALLITVERPIHETWLMADHEPRLRPIVEQLLGRRLMRVEVRRRAA